MASQTPITLRKALPSDIPAISRISHYGFRNHVWTRAMYPSGEDAAGNIARYETRFGKMFRDPVNTFEVAVLGPEVSDPSARVVGFAKWSVYPTARPESEWNVPYEPVPVPAGGRQEAGDIPGEILHRMKLRVYKGDPYVTLGFLVIDPEFQRRGVGGRLLQWGLARSNELGLPAYLEATEEGIGLYERNGFRTVDEIVVDTARWGLDEPIDLKCMRYEPGSRAA